MSHDPSSPSDRMDLEPDDEIRDEICEDCGQPLDFGDFLVEGFEATGRLLCQECSEERAAEDEDRDPELSI